MDSCIWTEHRGGTSYFSWLVGDVIRMIWLMLPSPLQASQVVDTLPIWHNRKPLHLHRRADGEIFRIDQVDQHRIEIYRAKGPPIHRTSFGNVNYHQDGLIYTNLGNIYCFDYETLNATELGANLPAGQILAISPTHILLDGLRLYNLRTRNTQIWNVSIKPDVKFGLTPDRIYLLEDYTQLRIFNLLTHQEEPPIRLKSLSTDFLVIERNLIALKYLEVYTFINGSGTLLDTHPLSHYIYRRNSNYHLVTLVRHPLAFAFHE